MTGCRMKLPAVAVGPPCSMQEDTLLLLLIGGLLMPRHIAEAFCACLSVGGSNAKQ